MLFSKLNVATVVALAVAGITSGVGLYAYQDSKPGVVPRVRVPQSKEVEEQQALDQKQALYINAL
jgi:hypothetical protein